MGGGSALDILENCETSLAALMVILFLMYIQTLRVPKLFSFSISTICAMALLL